MQAAWLQKNEGKNLLIFFNGWGMDCSPLSFLKKARRDVLVFFDYQSLEIPSVCRGELDTYRNIDILAWSMGVWAAEFLKNQLPSVRSRTAVNGTLFPIHEKWGIAPAVLDATLENLKNGGREKFYRRMFADTESFQRFLSAAPQRSLESQTEELKSLKKAILSHPLKPQPWDRVYIGEKDRIILASRQKAFWGPVLAPVAVPWPHFPFFEWEKENILPEEFLY